MSLSVDRDGAARALAMAGARHWPAHLGERPAVEAVADPELRSRLSAWAMATLALVGCDEAVNVDRAQVCALGQRLYDGERLVGVAVPCSATDAQTVTLLGERLRAGDYYEEEPEEGEASPKRFPGYAMVAPLANAAPLTAPGAAETARAGEDSGAGRSGPIEAASGTIDDVLCGGCGEPLEARQHKREGGLWSATCDRETCRWGWADCDYRPSVSNVLAYGDRLVSMRWVRAALERWGRRHEQARPVLSPESRPVLPEVLMWLREQGNPHLGSAARQAHMAALAEAVERRTEVGTERYGVPLHSHAGRDVMRDLGEELVDAVQYATQALMELDEDESDDDAAAWLESVRYHAAEAWCDLRRVGER
jgi:hypothetical protein